MIPEDSSSSSQDDAQPSINQSDNIEEGEAPGASESIHSNDVNIEDSDGDERSSNPNSDDEVIGPTEGLSHSETQNFTQSHSSSQPYIQYDSTLDTVSFIS